MSHPMLPARRRWLAAAGLLAVARPAAAWMEAGDTRVTGSGRVVTEARPVAGYRRVELRAPLNVTLRSRGREGLELRGDDNLLPLDETRVVDGTLVVGWKPGVVVSRTSELSAVIDLATLERLVLAGPGSVAGDVPAAAALRVALDGSGDVRLAGVQAGTLDLRLSGSGNLQAVGRADGLTVSLTGSGDIDAERLEAGDVAVSITGSGEAAVAPRRALRVAIVGSGDVAYRGDVTPQVSIAGSGRVRRR